MNAVLDTATTTAPVVSARRLRKQYKNKLALADTAFEIPAGRIQLGGDRIGRQAAGGRGRPGRDGGDETHHQQGTAGRQGKQGVVELAVHGDLPDRW